MAIERLGDILLLERIAVGGMAEVFRAKQYGHSGFEKTIAIKRILQSFCSNKEFKEMFRAEANLSAQLQHPNIAQVYSNGQHGEYLYIVMEFVDGKNLRQVIAKAEEKNILLPLELICYLICESAKGLEFAHTYSDEKTGLPLNIIHRDVNHQNIMLTYEGAVKVVDFGVAKVSEEERSKTRAGVLKGKISYMSPEQVRGRKIDCRSDVFSLGIVFWELLAGTTLFTADDEISTLQRVRDCQVPALHDYNSNVPPALQSIVSKALEKDVEKRYASARALCAELQKFLNEYNPAYLQGDAAIYLKDLFKEEIMAERIRKDKLNQEAKAFLAKSPILRASNTRIFGNTSHEQSPAPIAFADTLKGNTVVDQEDRTTLTSSVDSNLSALLASKEAPFSSKSNAQVSTPRFEYDRTSSVTSVYSSAVHEHYGKFSFFLFMILLGLLYTWFDKREKMLFASIEDAKNQEWSETFKLSFVQSCSVSTDVIPGNVESTLFCNCIAPSVEQAKVLSPFFNPNLISEEAHAESNLGEFRKFMKGPLGEELKRGCERKLSGDGQF